MLRRVVESAAPVTLGASYQLESSLKDMKTGTTGATLSAQSLPGAVPGKITVIDFQWPAMDETALVELPKIETRTGYLALLANLAALVWLYRGQRERFVTLLGRHVDRAIEAYKRVLAGKYCPRAVAYRIRHGLSDNDTAMAVLVLPMVRASSAGVVYTLDPACSAVGGKAVGVYVVDGLAAELVAGKSLASLVPAVGISWFHRGRLLPLARRARRLSWLR